MTITVDLRPEIEARLKVQAEAFGLPVPAYVQTLIETALAAPDRLGWPKDFFEQTYGSLEYDPVERLPQGEYETREPLR